MNERQRTLIKVLMAIAAGMVAFPPFHAVGVGGATVDRGYHFIASPPVGIASIDIARLAVQLLGLAIIGGGLWVLFKE